jgi:lambda repressor-like predicted transcriptional regulator
VPRTPEYNIWLAIKDRCLNPRSKMYPYYGGRGITICESWRISFEAFLRDVGHRPEPHLTLDRTDNNKGYWPGNVAWVTRAQQVRNRRNTILIEYRGDGHVLTDLARAHGVHPQTLANRLGKGMPVEDALSTTPLWSKREANAQAKLDAAGVLEIRRRLLDGDFQKTIAKDYGVSGSAIGLIKRGVTWGSL